MTVLHHPNRPSFEGAAPNLSGLEVMVRWNTGDQLKINDSMPEFKLLTVHPPVAYVKQTGVAAWFSQYTVQYRDNDVLNDLAGAMYDNMYNDPAYGVSVWIPVVIALSDATGQGIGGDKPIPEVYEDLGIRDKDALGLTFAGNYIAFAYGTAWGPTVNLNLTNPGTTPGSGAGFIAGFPADYYPVSYPAGSSDADKLKLRWLAMLGFSEEDWDGAADDAARIALAEHGR